MIGDYEKMAIAIVEGEAGIDPSIMEFIEDEGFFDEGSQVALLIAIFEDNDFRDLGEFEETFLSQMEDGVVTLLDVEGI